MADKERKAGHTVGMTAYHRTTAALHRSKQARRRVSLPTECARCGGIINEGDLFDMGHARDVAVGGADSELRPEHRRCNRRAGQRVGVQVREAKRARPKKATPEW
jgi:hypothetical protein